MRTGIYGGTFNPIHIGHLIIADDIRIQCGLDRIIFVPSGNPPHKKDQFIIDQSIRYDLIRQAISDNPHFMVDDHELNTKGYSYTIDTMSFFSIKYKDDDLFFIIGADCLYEIHVWKDAESMISRFNFLVAQRRNNPIDEESFKAIPLPNNLKNKLKQGIVNTPVIDVSATKIRDRIRQGKSIRYLVPESIRNYLEENNLFQNNGGVS
ncbi:MAG: nicotinate-nucleotide adenylyltransferase [Candidatus Auribacter fodinae]|jgi:nicotinate-nucleotide adenylyltransferase|uniref:Probable nicotinate-nucleotide adenylyltransferase n=1 Tax=Candidatus Auribacter fodinae TaxID=2093366 RepID=A0A3A4R562_9BACT|nr:MAG: nicotinate-nucleotide adenylyltransferase [Candidatus Auribacter fodinae]